MRFHHSPPQKSIISYIYIDIYLFYTHLLGSSHHRGCFVPQRGSQVAGLGVAKLILAARRLGAACPVMAMEQHGSEPMGVIGWALSRWMPRD